MYDVLVVGAGPAGSGVAENLARQGYKVLVVEEHAEVGKPVCCSGIIGRECLEQFSLPPELVLREARSASFYSPSGFALRLEKASPQAYIVDREALDKTLAQRAQKAGATYLLSARATSVTLDGSVRLDVEQQSKAHPIFGRALVLATGFGSALPLQLGLGEIGDYLPAAQAEVEVQGVEEVEVYLGQDVAPGSFAWLVPTAPGRGLAGLMCPRPAFYLQNFLRHLQEKGKVSAWGPLSYTRLPLRPLPRSYKRRVVVVGEAAGQVKPTTGGGIYYSLLAGQWASESLGQALDNDDFSLLSGYQKQWQQRLGSEMQQGRWLRRLYTQLSDGQIERGFRMASDSGLVDSFLQRDDLSFDWHAHALWFFLSKGGAKALLSGLVGTPLHIFGLKQSRKNPVA